MNQKERWFIVKVIGNLLANYTNGKSFNYMGNQQKEVYKDVHEVYDILGYSALNNTFKEQKTVNHRKAERKVAKKLNDVFSKL